MRNIKERKRGNLRGPLSRFVESGVDLRSSLTAESGDPRRRRVSPAGERNILGSKARRTLAKQAALGGPRVRRSCSRAILRHSTIIKPPADAEKDRIMLAQCRARPQNSGNPRPQLGGLINCYMFRTFTLWDDAYLRKLTSIFVAVIESGLEDCCANIDICSIRRIPCSFIAPSGIAGECCPGSWPKVFIRTAK